MPRQHCKRNELICTLQLVNCSCSPVRENLANLLPLLSVASSVISPSHCRAVPLGLDSFTCIALIPPCRSYLPFFDMFKQPVSMAGTTDSRTGFVLKMLIHAHAYNDKPDLTIMHEACARAFTNLVTPYHITLLSRASTHGRSQRRWAVAQRSCLNGPHANYSIHPGCEIPACIHRLARTSSRLAQR